jgi:hypothetical protein
MLLVFILTGTAMRVLPLLLFSGLLLEAYPLGSRIPAGNAGEPDTGTPCSSCHTVSVNPSGGNVSLGVPDTLTYKAGEAQSWVLSIADSSSGKRYGYQLMASTGSLSSSNGVVVGTVSGKVYLSQTASASSYTITWTPPSDATGEVKIYVAGLATSGTRSGNLYTAAYTLTPAETTPVTNAPSWSSTSPVLNAATGGTEASWGNILALSGTNLTVDSVSRH